MKKSKVKKIGHHISGLLVVGLLVIAGVKYTPYKELPKVGACYRDLGALVHVTELGKHGVKAVIIAGVYKKMLNKEIYLPFSELVEPLDCKLSLVNYKYKAKI